MAGDRNGQRPAYRYAINARITSHKTPLALAGGVYFFLLWLAVLLADRLWPLPLHEVTPARVVVAEDGTPLWRFCRCAGRLALSGHHRRRFAALSAGAHSV